VSVKTVAFTKNHVKALKIANGSTHKRERERERERGGGGKGEGKMRSRGTFYQVITSVYPAGGSIRKHRHDQYARGIRFAYRKT